MTPRAKWITHTILSSHTNIGLCLTDEQLQREKKLLKVDGALDFPLPGNGRVLEFTNKELSYCNIVCLNIPDDAMPVSINGLIAHESVHVYQHIMDYIGEENPGTEIEAYIIQTIFENLCEAYNAVKGKKCSK